MKKINIRFEQDRTLGDIEVVFRASEADADVEAMMKQLAQYVPKRLTVLDRDNCTCVVNEADVILVSADGKQATVTAAGGIYRAKQSLQSLEELLGGKFLRVSRFELINLEKVHRYDFTIGGTLRIEFDNGMETWASRRYIPLIRKRLSGEEGYLC